MKAFNRRGNSRGGPVAVLGSGSAGLKHLRAFRACGANPIAIPIRPGRRQELEKAGFQTASTLEEAAERGARACVVATDTARHASDAVAAARLGFDLLVEKPLARDAKEARRCVEQVHRLGRRLYVACLLRRSAALQRFLFFLRRVGKLHSVHVECRSYLPDWARLRPYRETYSARKGEGGVLRDLIHEIDYAGWLFGFPSKVHGGTRNLDRLGIESEESAHLYWTAEAGHFVSMDLDYLTRPPRRRMTAFGERGTLEVDLLAQSLSWSPAKGAVKIIRAPQSVEALFALQAKSFLAALEGSEEEFLAGARDGIAALTVCDAVRRNPACVPLKI